MQPAITQNVPREKYRYGLAELVGVDLDKDAIVPANLLEQLVSFGAGEDVIVRTIYHAVVVGLHAHQMLHDAALDAAQMDALNAFLMVPVNSVFQNPFVEAAEEEAVDAHRWPQLVLT